MTPTDDEVNREITRLSGTGVITPQERDLLEVMVTYSRTGRKYSLYQKALAEVLGIQSAKQIGVLATRIRHKLRTHYKLHEFPRVELRLNERGYEVSAIYVQASRLPSDGVLLSVANARAALAQRTMPGIESALRYVSAALTDDPNDPLLLSLHAQCHATRALYGPSPRADLETADATLRALGPDPSRPPEYWIAEASVRMVFHWDWSGADASFQRAIALSDGEARFNPWYTALLTSQGRAADAVEHLRVAVSREPDSPVVRADLAINQIYAGQFRDAEETIASALALFGPRAHYLLHVHRAILHEARDERARASAAINNVPLKWPKTAITLGLRALFMGLNGEYQAARWHLSKLKSMRLLAGRRVPAIHIALGTLGVGDTDGAVAWLREACLVERDPNAVLNNVYPFFRHLHSHLGFRDLVSAEMKLPLPEAVAAP